MLNAADYLAADGPLARHVTGFRPRPQQQEMAAAVETALVGREVLVCEAGTGTGKTFAYLVPALLSGLRVIISTGTKSLQEQLYHRDLPLVLKALGPPVKAVLLKGRANYLCRYRLDNFEAEGPAYLRQLGPDLARVRAWAGATRSGDIAEVADVPEDAPVWRHATSTADNCLGQECPAVADCHVLKARRAAAEADVLVVNHHLFFADMALRDGGFGELLPDADAIVLDEAHQVPEVAAQFFGASLSSRQLVELARDAQQSYAREAGDVPGFEAVAQSVDQASRDFRLALGADSRRGAWVEVAGGARVSEALGHLHGRLLALEGALEPLAERGRGLNNCLRRCQECLAGLSGMTGQATENHLQWYETYTRAFILHLTPLDIAGPFGARMAERRCAWVFTSATLAVDGRFDHFAQSLGLEEPTQGLWQSPFDFTRQALCYVPPALPDPGAHDYTGRMLDAAVPVLEASRGRAFVLFTSYRALHEAAERLPARLPYPILVQGDAPRSQLLERFRTTPNAILLGTSSFWEGIDVRGEALSCVIIDKLPFASPGDPVLQARYAAIRNHGGNPFMDYQLPQAVIALKQGVGRLIRDVNDRGVLVLCDPRLMSRGYGRVFLNSLPALPRTRELAQVQAFFDDGQNQDPQEKREHEPCS